MKQLDIETLLCELLSELLDVSVSTEVPAPRPQEFITVERTGGACDSVIVDRPVIAIQCWATSRTDAADLAYEVDGIIPQLVHHPSISKAQRNSLYNFPDLVSNTPRYQVVVNLVITSV